MAKTRKRITGDIGEALAESEYIKHGFTVVAADYIVGGGEIDLVLYKLGTLVFAEVKTRTSDKYGRPLDAVDKSKIEHLTRAERAFVRQNVVGGRLPVYSRLLKRMIKRRVLKIRNDIVEVYPTDNPTVNIIKNAFEADL